MSCAAQSATIRDFGVYPGAVDDARAALSKGADVCEALDRALRRPRGDRDGLALALLASGDPQRFGHGFGSAVGLDAHEAARAAEVVLEVALEEGLLLTGAEAVSLLLGRLGANIAFAYPGTSELSLADALARTPGIDLVNGRGDKESAFMAAGASLLAPCRGVAVLHGARGLTNAVGAIADIRRNEIGTLVCVGLPSTASSCFLPPHGEHALMSSIGAFAKRAVEATEAPDTASAPDFLAMLIHSIAEARRRPRGPVLIGIPQDVAEATWIPFECMTAALEASTTAPGDPRQLDATASLADARALLARHERVVILVDDYLLRYDDPSSALAEFSERVAAPVLQVRYRRGPMLFERLRREHVPTFAGWLDPDDPDQVALLEQADLLVTVEDRNLYRRVVGELPGCRKLALTSDAATTRKNGYLDDGDLVLEGDVVDLLRGLAARVERRPIATVARGHYRPRAAESLTVEAQRLREAIVDALASALAPAASPALVDDGQMFGGLLAACYDRLPPTLRVFGDHGGFVGAGIGHATGLALSEPSLTVICVLGDQGFGNGFQGLVAAAQERAPVTFLVCNNGGSVSLLKQALAARARWFDDGRQGFLDNAPTVDAVAVAEALGIGATRIAFDLASGIESVNEAARSLRRVLSEACASQRPRLIEIVLPPLGEAWAGIWITGGFDEQSVETRAVVDLSSGAVGD